MKRLLKVLPLLLIFSLASCINANEAQQVPTVHINKLVVADNTSITTEDGSTFSGGGGVGPPGPPGPAGPPGPNSVSTNTTTTFANGVLTAASGNVSSVPFTGSTTQFLDANGNFSAIPYAGTFTYYLQDTASAVATYKKMLMTPYTPKTSENFTGLADNATLINYITEAGSPGLTFIPAGSFEFHIHAAKVAGTKTANLHAEIWEAGSTGTDIAKIGDTEATGTITGSEVEYRVFLVTSNVYTTNSTASRLVVRVKVAVGGAGTAPDVTLWVGGTADSHFTLPTQTVDASNFVPYSGATTNVNLGSNNITASAITATTANITDLAADINFNKYKAIAMVCDNGATVPAAPVAGQWFLHTPTGRSVLLMYDGSNWIPIISLGTMTVYVDKTDGTDAVDKGGAVDAGAVKTVQYAVNLIPGLIGGDVAVNCTGESYGESLIIQGKNAAGNYSITISGSMTQLDSLSAVAGSVQGGGATQGTVVAAAASFVAGARANKLVRFTSGVNNGYYHIIDSNTTTTLTIADMWEGGAPANTDTFVTEDWGTTITSVTIYNAGAPIVLDRLNTVVTATQSNVTMRRCTWSGAPTFSGGLTTCTHVYGYVSTTANCLSLTEFNKFLVTGGKYVGGNTGGSIIVLQGQAYGIIQGAVIDGSVGNKANYGVYAIAGSKVSMTSNGAIYTRVVSCDTGCATYLQAGIWNTAYVTYASNGTNESNSAATYSYID